MEGDHLVPRDPHPAAPNLQLGVTETMIHSLIHTFYARVRADAVLGPIFNEKIADWDHHLAKLCDSWQVVC